MVLKNTAPSFPPQNLHYELGLRKEKKEVYLELHFEGEYADSMFLRFSEMVEEKLDPRLTLFENPGEHKDRIRGIKFKETLTTDHEINELAAMLLERLEIIENNCGKAARDLTYRW